MHGAIFDVDGTLLDSMSVWWDVLIDFFKNHGSELTDEEAMKYKEYTLGESVPIMIDILSLDMTEEEVFEELRGMIFNEYRDNIPMKDGAKEYIKKLHDNGVKIAIATSGYEELCKAALTRHGVWQYIDACAFSSEVGVNKSHPDIYLLAAKRLGVEPQNCDVYEDIVNGIKGAKKGCFTTYAIYDDSNAEDTDALKQLSDHYITGWKDLLQR